MIVEDRFVGASAIGPGVATTSPAVGACQGAFGKVARQRPVSLAADHIEIGGRPGGGDPGPQVGQPSARGLELVGIEQQTGRRREQRGFVRRSAARSAVPSKRSIPDRIAAIDFDRLVRPPARARACRWRR